MSTENVIIRQTEGLKGKGLFALKAIKKDATIFEETPFVSCQFSWNETYKYQACKHCMTPLETTEENVRRLTNNQLLQLPFKECCTTNKLNIVSCPACRENYCSEACRTLAFNQYHRVLCTQAPPGLTHPLDQLNETWKTFHYPPETGSIMLLVRIIATAIQAEDRAETIGKILNFCHESTSESTGFEHKLLGEKFVEQLDVLYNLFSVALPQKPGLEQFFTPDGFRTLFSLCARNQQGVGTSPLSKWVENVAILPLNEPQRKEIDEFIDDLYTKLDEFAGNFLNNEGVALYCLQSACNHSCKPNAEIRFLNNSNKLSLVALEDLQENDEICISYLDECSLARSRHSRRKELMENYLFACDCHKCEEEIEQDDVTSEEEMEDEDLSE